MDTTVITFLATLRVDVSHVMNDDNANTICMLYIFEQLKNKHKFHSPFDTSSASNELIESYADIRYYEITRTHFKTH